MGLRQRLTLLTTLVVGGVIAIAAVASYAALRAELRGQVDDQLTGYENPQGVSALQGGA